MHVNNRRRLKNQTDSDFFIVRFDRESGKQCRRRSIADKPRDACTSVAHSVLQNSPVCIYQG